MSDWKGIDYPIHSYSFRMGLEPQKSYERLGGVGGFLGNTLPETNIAPENGWLEYYFPIGMTYF